MVDPLEAGVEAMSACQQDGGGIGKRLCDGHDAVCCLTHVGNRSADPDEVRNQVRTACAVSGSRLRSRRMQGVQIGSARVLEYAQVEFGQDGQQVIEDVRLYAFVRNPADGVGKAINFERQTG